MTPKEFFNKGRRLNFEIEQLIQAKKKAFDLARNTGTSYDGEKVQTSKGNTSENKFVTYADYSAEIDKRIEELNKYRCDMMALINKLDNTVYRTLLIARYINCKRWEDIAAEFNFKDVRNVYILHGKALQEISHMDII